MIRITGGELRGRALHTPANERTRPTQAKLRQALFNSLQLHISGARVLDLFAGSGALGFEALSRGAAWVTFVESAKPVVKLLQRNASDLGLQDRTRIVGASVGECWSRVTPDGPFDLVLADPPYAAGWELRLLYEAPWEELLPPGGRLCLEWGLQKSEIKDLPERAGFLVKVREKTYGDSVLTTYQREEAPE